MNTPMSATAMTPEEIAEITGFKHHFFRISATDVTLCSCCDLPMDCAFEPFSHSSDQEPGNMNTGVAAVCINCVLAKGREGIIQAVSRELDRLIDAMDDSNRALWYACREQIDRGFFEIQMPKDMRDLGHQMTKGTRETVLKRENALLHILGNIH